MDGSQESESGARGQLVYRHGGDAVWITRAWRQVSIVLSWLRQLSRGSRSLNRETENHD